MKTRVLLVLALLLALSGAAQAQSQPYSKYSGEDGAAHRSGVLVTGLIELHGCIITNTNAAAQYIQFFNSTTVPADATIPVMAPIIAPAATSFGIDMGSATRRIFTVGVAWAQSSTAATKTLAGTSDTYISCTYN